MLCPSAVVAGLDRCPEGKTRGASHDIRLNAVRNMFPPSDGPLRRYWRVRAPYGNVPPSEFSLSVLFTIGGIAMKTIARWADMESFGIEPLTGEACSLMLRTLCDLTASAEQVDMMKRCHHPARRFAYHGPFQDRNQHQMSARLR